MISLFPCQFPNFTKSNNSVWINGALFDIQNSFKLELSTPKGINFINFLEAEGCCLVEDEFDEYKPLIYDFFNHKVIREISDCELFAIRNPDKQYSISRNKKEPTIIRNIKTNEIVFQSEEYIGNDLVFFGDVIIIKESSNSFITAIEAKTKNILWQGKQRGAYFLSKDSKFVTVHSNILERSTDITCRDIPTGKIDKVLHLDEYYSPICTNMCNPVYSHSLAKHYEILNFDVDSASFAVVGEMEKLGDFSIYIKDSFYHNKNQDQFDVWSGEFSGVSTIKKCDSKGKYVGEVVLPNTFFHSIPSYLGVNSKVCTYGQSSTPWPNNYWHIVVWDESDFENENSEVFEEPLLGKSEKRQEDDQTHYRIYVEDKLERYFDLHRQLSVKLHQEGSIHGFCMNNDRKERDPEFNGRLICDVSNQSLNDQEKLAIKHMCEHIEFELADGGFRSSYDPADKIRIEPLFND